MYQHGNVSTTAILPAFYPLMNNTQTSVQTNSYNKELTINPLKVNESNTSVDTIQYRPIDVYGRDKSERLTPEMTLGLRTKP